MPISRERREYLRQYQKQWMKKRRSEFFKGKCCIECGSNEELQLDHINPKEKWTHNIWSYQKEIRESELAKCQVLCKSCHKKKTHRDMGYGNPTHGCVSTYRKYKCRCNACREAYSLKRREKYKRIKK